MNEVAGCCGRRWSLESGLSSITKGVQLRRWRNPALTGLQLLHKNRQEFVNCNRNTEKNEERAKARSAGKLSATCQFLVEYMANVPLGSGPPRTAHFDIFLEPPSLHKKCDGLVSNKESIKALERCKWSVWESDCQGSQGDCGRDGVATRTSDHLAGQGLREEVEVQDSK